MMTVLALAQSAARLLSVGVPSSLVGSNNKNALFFLEVLARSCQKRARQYRWPQLIKEHEFDLVSGQRIYALPFDFISLISSAAWDEDNSRPLEGPIAADRWSELQYGVTATGPFHKYRVAGYQQVSGYNTMKVSNIQIDPTPGSGDAGKTMKFAYISSNCFRPQLWTPSTAYPANTIRQNDYGVLIYNPSAGTSGTTRPNFYSGNINDGNLDWYSYSVDYQRPLYDDDTTAFEDDLVISDLVWMWRYYNRFDFADMKKEADAAWATYFAQCRGGATVNLSGGSSTDFLIDGSNIPDTGYGL